MKDEIPDNIALINDAIERVSNGETTAFEVVVRQLERPLRSWLAAHAPPGIDIDEIAQRSFIKAFTNLQEYEAGSNFGAWLFSIAKYQLMTETTRLRRIADYHARYGPDLLQRELIRRCEESPEMWADRLESLQKCVDSLSDQLRQFVDWRYNEEVPLEEMAKRSNRSVAAVKKQLWKIRQQLQKCVETRVASAQGGSI